MTVKYLKKMNPVFLRPDFPTPWILSEFKKRKKKISIAS
jgi:hypothetical protein